MRSSTYMPRSYVWVRLLLVGTEVRVERYAILIDTADSGSPVYGIPHNLILEEMVKIWGSLAEGTVAPYGEPAPIRPKDLPFFKQRTPLPMLIDGSSRGFYWNDENCFI